MSWARPDAWTGWGGAVQASETHTEERAGSVVLVDDDALFRDTLAHNLEGAGFQVRVFSDGTQALQHLESAEDVGVVLLDWRMPGLSGLEVLRRLRRSREDLPVVFLTALGAPFYEETALLDGAVDYIEKSRTFRIIERRVRAILDRGRATATEMPAAEREHVGRLTMFPASCRADWDGVRVDLTPAEFAIVHHLASRAGDDVPYQSLYAAVRGPAFVAGANAEGFRTNVRAFVRRIRQKFVALDPAFDAIRNFAGFGYRWEEGGGPDLDDDG